MSSVTVLGLEPRSWGGRRAAVATAGDVRGLCRCFLAAGGTTVDVGGTLTAKGAGSALLVKLGGGRPFVVLFLFRFFWGSFTAAVSPLVMAGTPTGDAPALPSLAVALVALVAPGEVEGTASHTLASGDLVGLHPREPLSSATSGHSLHPASSSSSVM